MYQSDFKQYNSYNKKNNNNLKRFTATVFFI